MYKKGFLFPGDDRTIFSCEHGTFSGVLSRRALLQGLAALGTTAALTVDERVAHAQASNPRRLDVHYHFLSPGWLAFLNKNHDALTRLPGYDPNHPMTGMDVIPRFKDYSPEKAIEQMDRAGVATSFLSVTTPGIWFGNIEETRRVAREMNEYATKLKSDYKGRYGVFAVLPVPDVDGSLREIEYAFDTLKVEGVGFLSSYRDRWLGHASFAPIWDELNRRQAVVYTHASAPDCCLLNFVPKVGDTTIEFSADMARTIVNLIESGTANRTPNVKYIWSHGGGTIFASRYLNAAASAENLAKTAAPNSKLYHLRRFYYDTAATTDAIHLQTLKLAVGLQQVVFGTDFPWGSAANIAAELQKSGLTPDELRGIDRENALRILPQYRA